MALNFKPVVLVILDGFGLAPPAKGNAIASAKKPFFNQLITNYPLHLLEASSLSVGLPQSEVGNSEVGHISIGSGIVRYQSLPRINRSISTGQFFKLQELTKALKRVKSSGGKLHLIGLIGNGGVHASQEHLEALISMCKKVKVHKNTFLHVFLDGRDTGKDTGQIFMKELLKFSKKKKIAGIATMAGRMWGMDRNKNWDRIEVSYNAIVNGQAKIKHRDPLKAIEESYKKNVFDEEIPPHVFTDKKDQPLATIDDKDVVVFFNFRADRARQLTQSLVVPGFKQFKTKPLKNIQMVTFTEYEKDLPVTVLYPVEIIKNPLAKVFSNLNLRQLHIAETEKYAHVTFFLNGMVEDSFSGEKRILVPSPAVPTYDKKPEMSAAKVTDEIIKAVKADQFDFIVVNYANADMVGHTGNVSATIKAVEAVDLALSRLVPEVAKKGGSVFIVGDHGNAEELINPITGKVDKEHNVYPVPFITVNNQLMGKPTPGVTAEDISVLPPVGILADIAPTMLKTIGLSVPPEMTGNCLL